MLRRPPSHQYQNEITFITAIITLHNIALHYTFTIAILHVIIKYGSCTTDLPQACSQKSISQSVPEHVLSIFSLAKHGHLVDGSELGGWLKRLLWPGMVLALTCCTGSTPGVSKSLYWGIYYIHTFKNTLLLSDKKIPYLTNFDFIILLRSVGKIGRREVFLPWYT